MALKKIKVFTSYTGDVELTTDPETGEISAERKDFMYETGIRGAESLVLSEYPDLHASLDSVVGPAITAALAQIDSKLAENGGV